MMTSLFLQGIQSSLFPCFMTVQLNEWAVSSCESPLLLHADIDRGIVVASHGDRTDFMVHLDRYGYQDRIGNANKSSLVHNTFVHHANRRNYPIDNILIKQLYVGMMLDELSSGAYPEIVVLCLRPLNDPFSIGVRDVMDYFERIGIKTVNVESAKSITIKPERI